MTDDWQVVNVHDAIHHVWQLLRMPQQFPAVALQTQIGKALTLTLPSVLLEQVLANVVLNAAQAGATTVWFSAQREDGDVSIQVQDNAGGIDEVQLYQAFQPFMTTRKEGMGLGLAICQRLVRYANGDIEIKNHQAPDEKAGVVVTLHFKQNPEGGRRGNHSSAG